jgi:predicted NAD/FAD-binding protein
VKIAIVGSGISGLTCAYLLHPRHQITLFEANDYLGGHTHTIRVETPSGPLAVDTGFIVYNDRTYPNFIGLLDELGVESRATTMGFSVHCDRCGLEYSGASLGTLFAQRRNLWRPAHYRLLADIVRFSRESIAALDRAGDGVTLGDFLRRGRYSAGFCEHYLLPMGAAIWSCPMTVFAEFPLRFVVEFYRNHGLLQIRDRPTWRVIAGGSRVYVDRLARTFSDCVRLATPVRSIQRDETEVRVTTSEGTESFDEVILACHSDQALRMLAAPTAAEREVLSAFPYSRNRAVLHTDTSILPRLRSTWSSWNYHVPAGPEARPTVTYDMNILQHLETPETYCVTLNDPGRIDPRRVLGEYDYSHPVFTLERAAAQRRQGELIRSGRTSFSGAYWGNGFHEDGVNSALAVCRAFGVTPAWAARAAVVPAELCHAS